MTNTRLSKIVISIALGCGAMLGRVTHASSITWTNTVSGGWDTAANWNPNTVPGAADTAIITNTGVTVALNSSTTVGAIILGTNGAGPVTLSLASQTLALNGPLTVNPSGSFTVDSGTLTGNTNAVLSGTIGWTSGLLRGGLTLASGSTLTISTPSNNHNLGTCLLTNYGTVNWSGDQLYAGSGTVIYNYGLWNAQDDQTWNNYYGGAGTVFNNYGTLRKSGGTNTSQTLFANGVVLNQLAGVVDVQSNGSGLNLILQGGGSFTGGYVTTNTGGLTYFSAGSFTLNGTVTSTNVINNAAGLVGTNVIKGGLTWQAGNWNNTTLTVTTNSLLVINTPSNNHLMGGCLFTNYGTVNWSGDQIYTGNGTAFYNYGLWNAQDDQTLNDYYGGAGTVFNNYGTLRKSGGTNTSQTLFANGVVLNQLAGVVDVQSNGSGLNLILQGGGSFTGGYVTTNTGGLTYFSAGSFTLNGTVTSTNVINNAAGLVGTNVIKGGLTWQAGNWNNTTLTVTTNSLLVINTPSNNHLMGGCLFTNYGTVNWSGDQIYTGNGTVIYNYGLWNAQDDQTLNDYYGGAGTVFNNYGTLRKSGGVSELANNTVFASGVVMNQIAGMIDVQNGTNGLQLNFQGGGNFTGGFVTTNVSGLTVLGAGSFVLNGTLTGTNTWENNGNLVDTNFINGSLTWQGGTWNGAEYVTINPGSTLIVSGGSAYGTGNNDMNSTTVTNNGTVQWVSGTIRGGNSGVVYNYGLWNAQSDQTFNQAFGAGAEVFNNYGTFRKSGGGPEFTNATYFASGVAFNQLAGVIDVQNGTNGLQLDFQYGGNFTGGYITTNQFGLTVLSAGSFTINGTVTGTNTWEDSGNLVGNNVINGALTWVGGGTVSLWNGATVTILANSTVIATGGSLNDLNGSTVTNYGTFTWSSGTIRGGNSGVVYNYGLWNAQSDQTFNQAYGGGIEVFNNYGTFRKSGGASEFASSTLFTGGVLFNQLAGVIDVQNGTNGLQLALQGGANLTGGYITTNQYGLTVLSVGNFTINGTATGTNTWEDTGNLVGNNVINGALTWVGGGNVSLWNGANVTILTNSTVIATGGSLNDLNGSSVTNYGTFVWANATIRGGNSGVVYNYGLWNAQSDQTFSQAYGGGTEVFNNYGTFRKSGGGPEFTNATYFGGGVLFNQLAGVVDVQNSTNGLQLALQGGGNFTGGYITTNQYGLTVLSQGNFVINGAVTGTNTWEDIGNLVNTNVINGALTWVGGSWNATEYVTIATNSTLIVAGGSGNNDLQTTIITNNGTVLWASGTLRGGNNTTIVNNGVWNAQSDQVFNQAFGGGNVVFNNLGSFVKSGGVNNGSGSQIQTGVNFNNSGRLDVQAGVISLQGAYNLAAGTLNFGINSLTNYGEIGLSGAAALVGSVSANLNGGYQPISGNSFTNLYYGSYSGAFTNATLPFADAWNTNYFPTYFVLTVLNARPVLPTLATNRFVVNELTLLAVTNTATDADIPSQTLTYSLVAGTNGMTVNSATGIFSWTPQQTNSPTTNLVAVAVTDNGTPALSATNFYTVVVQEVNVPPTLPTVSTQTVNELTLLTVTDTATNSNIHSTNSGYALVSPPSGMVISSSGIITWTPTQIQSPSTNTIAVIVTNSNPYDLINPQLTATNTFKVVVKEVNVPATLPTIATQTVNELTLLTVTNGATNANIHATIFGYTLVSPPSNMVISASGIVTWTPAQAQSPSTNIITTIVTNTDAYDLVNPHLTATNFFTVIVKEVNQAPILGVVGIQTATLLQLFTLSNSATEPNIHSTNAGYLLVSPPAGASISTSGVITWTPAPSQTLTTNTLTTIVTNNNPYDLVTPHLSATNNFSVVVLPNLTRTNITMVAVGGSTLALTWPADHTGWKVQGQTNALTKGLGTNWATLPGSATTNQVNVPITKTNSSVFFRLSYP
jgi:hypothetical protein